MVTNTLTQVKLHYLLPSFLVWLLPPTHCRCTGSLFHLVTFNYTYTLAKSPLDEASARRKNSRQHTTCRSDRYAPAGFEPAMQARERPQTYALGHVYITARTDTTKQTNAVWAYIARHVWLLLIRRVCPHFCRQRDFFCRRCYRYNMYAFDDDWDEFLLFEDNEQTKTVDTTALRIKNWRRIF